MTDMLQKQIEEILSYPERDLGVDILILSTSSQTQCTYWEKRLNDARGHLLKKEAVVLSIYEDWPGGAGNAFGTLYAFNEANTRYEALFGQNLFQELQRGKSVAIYHTAGKGTRLAPLSLAEYNNKPGVELPAFSANELTPLTVLEMVIKQTAPLCHQHAGRVLVFWSDQIFVPSDVLKGPRHHVEIFAKHIDTPSVEEWQKKQLDQYGLIAFNKKGSPFLVNKITYQDYQTLIAKGLLDPSKGLSLSIGSFSLSPSLLKGLLTEFADELASKRGQLDADTCLWMPSTLEEETYLYLMGQKKKSEEVAKSIWARARRATHPFSEILFAPQEIGGESYWWDLGNCRSFYTNTMKLLEPTAEGYHLRLLFGYLGLKGNNQFERCQIDSSSLIVNTRIKNSKITKSILVGLEASNIELSKSIVIGGQLCGLRGDETLLYHVYSPLTNTSQELFQLVRADLYYPPHEEPIAFYTLFSYEGHQVFEERLPQNVRSFQEQYDINQTLQLEEAKQFAREKSRHGLIKI